MDTFDCYRQMRRIRRLEETLVDLKNAGEILGSVHPCNGQEAVPVGAATALRSDDYITATYRGHGWAVVAGIALVDIFAEVLGRASNLNGGRGASPYFSSPGVNFIGENSIVGAGLPIACGAALSAMRDGRAQVSLVSIGDGATNQGAVHEALNLAAVMTLPLVVVVENNVYSEMSPIAEMTRVVQLAERGAAYGIPATIVDGNDAAEVAAAVDAAVARARGGGGPTMVEAMTQRYVGHHSGDVQHYRPTGEVERARADEPLARLRAAADDDTLVKYSAVDIEVDAEIDNALTVARTIPEPDPGTVLEHIYV
ncbi:MAG TPA: thiamine pyrophosphate-dependent dehydrogenase E1 component subunit alpha [Acidothermaceae bacterium]|nr:thiamine pyrophosphate-dependent dehydrogenase E1 component subunit alpha [Acidothermaceae bacterium]